MGLPLLKPSTTEVKLYKDGIKRHFGNGGHPDDLFTMPITHTREHYADTLEAVRETTKEWPKILVYSSSRAMPLSPVFMQHAGQTGEMLADTNAVYVYGNGNSGAMGEAAHGFIKRRAANNGHAHHIIGVSTGNFKAVEEDLPGVVVFLSRDIDLRVRLMIDLADAIIALPGGLGTYEEMHKFLSQDGYIYKSGRPIVCVNSEFEHPKRGRIKFYDDWRKAMQLTLDTEATTPRHLQNLYFADTPADAVNFLTSRVEGLKWAVPADKRPEENRTGIQTLDFSDLA